MSSEPRSHLILFLCLWQDSCHFLFLHREAPSSSSSLKSKYPWEGLLSVIISHPLLSVNTIIRTHWEARFSQMDKRLRPELQLDRGHHGEIHVETRAF